MKGRMIAKDNALGCHHQQNGWGSWRKIAIALIDGVLSVIAITTGDENF
jgi:hypothetical protein